MVLRYRTQAEAYSGSATSAGALYNIRYLLIAYAATKWGAAHGHGPVNAGYLAKIKQFSNWNLDNGTYNESWGILMAYDWFYSDICIADGGTVSNNVCSASTSLANLRATADTLLTRQQNAINGDSPMNDVFYITDGLIGWLPLALAMYDPGDATNAPVFLKHVRFAMDVELNMALPIWKKEGGGMDYCPNASTDSDTLCGGAWQDNWNDYTNHSGGVFHHMIHGLLCWAAATGQAGLVNGVPQFFANNGWIKNYAYWMMYQVRPDFVIEPLGSISRPNMNSEYPNSNAAGDSTGGTKSGLFGMLDALAAIYNDPTIRGWSRLIDWSVNNSTVQTPDGYEPTAWPYYTPDKAALATNTRSTLSGCRNFPGWGAVYCRTGFGESDTFFTLRYGDGFWTHPNQETGAFTLFNRGPLAIRSGGYRPGSLSFNQFIYSASSISQNTLGICDPADRYTNETYPVCSAWYANCLLGNPAGDVQVIAPNDCGQRRTGSTFGNTIGSLSGSQQSPADFSRWLRSREYYHNGSLIAWTVNPNQYAYGAIDMTPAYNNYYSMNAHVNVGAQNEANTSNRTYRATKAVRHFLWIPRGTAAYVVIYDQVNTKASTFTKNWYVHSINQSAVPNPAFPTYANSYAIARTELVNSTYAKITNGWPLPWGGSLTFCPSGCTTTSTQYQYNGKLYGFMPWPTGGSLTTVGGAGHEFSITDATTGIEANYNECRYQQCGSEFGSTIGSVAGPWTLTAGSTDTLCIGVDGAACTNLTLTAGAGRTCAQVRDNLNTLLSGASIGATASCEGQTSPLSYLAVRSNSNTLTTCSALTGPSGTCSGVIIGAANANATFGLIAGAFCAVNAYGTGATCNQSAGALGFDEGYEAVGGLQGFIHPNAAKGPQQPGAWRIVGWTGANGTNANHLSDQFINVMLATSASDTNVVSTAPVTTATTLNGLAVLQTVWKDNSDQCTYTATFYVDGVGGTLTTSGAGCAAVIN